LILTKPLGTQVAVNLNEWLIENDDKWTNKAKNLISSDRAKEAYFMAVESMGILNKNAAYLMNKY